MSESLVGFGHLVHVFPTLHRCAEAVAGVEDLVGEAQRHGLLTPLTAVADQPTDGEGAGPAALPLDGDLVRRATDAAALHLELGLHVLDGSLERGERLAAGLLLHDLHGVVDDALGDRALPPE